MSAKSDRQDGDGLLPCPFCGSDNLKSGGVVVWCLACQATGPDQYSKTNWNTRAPTRDGAEGAGEDYDSVAILATGQRLLDAKAAPPKPAPDAMREALQPFAQLFERFEKGKKEREDNWPSDHVEFNARPRTDKESMGYTFGDLRRAHEALSAPMPPADGARQWPRVFNVKRAENTWHADISFARYPTDAELQALEISLRGVHPTSDRETFYTILRKYYAQDADFDNLWQELNEAGLVS